MIDIVFDHRQAITADTYTFWFQPTQPFFYTAGQFTELYLAHTGADDRGLRRYFTLSSSPTESLLGITTRFAGTAGSTFKHHLLQLKPGTHIQAAEAMGDFVLPKDTTIPIVLIAAGIGATPMRSMIRWLIDTNGQRQVSLIQAAGTPEGLIFQDVWQGYPLGYTPLVKRPSANFSGDSGPLRAAYILRTAPPDKRSLYYLSGPEQLVEKLTKDLIAAGIPDYRVITDYFHGYAVSI